MIYTINVELASWNVIDIIVVMDNIVFALHHGLLRMAYYKGVLQRCTTNPVHGRVHLDGG
jgi:hypothetical protein